MKSHPRKSTGKPDIVALWDGMDFVGRLNMIRENLELFWAERLISESEAKALVGMRESEREYIVSREDHPILASIEVKQNMEAQVHRDKLKAALSAVFS